MTLAADEFIRRFLLYVLPDGFQRIRYYGFPWQSLSTTEALPESQKDYRDHYQELTGVSPPAMPGMSTRPHDPYRTTGSGQYILNAQGHFMRTPDSRLLSPQTCTSRVKGKVFADTIEMPYQPDHCLSVLPRRLHRSLSSLAGTLPELLFPTTQRLSTNLYTQFKTHSVHCIVAV